VRTFGIQSEAADVRANHLGTGTDDFQLLVDGTNVGTVTLITPGIHSVYNALAASAAATVLGISPEILAPALSRFGGLHRRFEIINEGTVTFVDDYAHHPHAIALTIETARKHFPHRRLVAVFQPTLYTRLYRFLKSYSEAFDQANAVVIVETQPSREVDTGLVHGKDLVQAIAGRPAWRGREDMVSYGGTYDETATALRRLRQDGDVVVVMGSGPVNQVIAGARAGG
jgi:UDP-N-acetylmuramate--alanine ligase